MLVFVHDRLPTGIGESLSGSKAFFVNALLIADWHAVEEHPDYNSLSPAEKEEVREKFPLCVEYYRAIKSVDFH